MKVKESVSVSDGEVRSGASAPENLCCFRRCSRALARHLTRWVDYFYIAPVRAVMPLQTFRYAACGGANLVLSWVLYAVVYNFVLGKQLVDLGFVAISAPIAAFLIVFPITYLSGFWLQKYIAFKASPLRTRTQLVRYLLSVCGSVVLNYLGLKFFIEVVHLWPTFSQVITSLITIVYSYLMQKYFTFRGCVEV